MTAPAAAARPESAHPPVASPSTAKPRWLAAVAVAIDVEDHRSVDASRPEEVAVEGVRHPVGGHRVAGGPQGLGEPFLRLPQLSLGEMAQIEVEAVDPDELVRPVELVEDPLDQRQPAGAVPLAEAFHQRIGPVAVRDRDVDPEPLDRVAKRQAWRIASE